MVPGILLGLFVLLLLVNLLAPVRDDRRQKHKADHELFKLECNRIQSHIKTAKSLSYLHRYFDVETDKLDQYYQRVDDKLFRDALRSLWAAYLNKKTELRRVKK